MRIIEKLQELVAELERAGLIDDDILDVRLIRWNQGSTVVVTLETLRRMAKPIDGPFIRVQDSTPTIQAGSVTFLTLEEGYTPEDD